MPTEITSRNWAQQVAVWAYIVMLAWVPFPLGSAVAWGAGLFEILVGICWFLWIVSNISNLSVMLPNRMPIWIAAGLFLSALAWALLQSLPVLPSAWTNPIWQIAQGATHLRLADNVSINPWRTQSEFLKLVAEIGAAWLSFSMSRDSRNAALIFNSVILIGAAYVIYAFTLIFLRLTQPQIIYHIEFGVPFVSGPFMLHNSFATYCGLASLAATARLISLGSDSIITDRGGRRFLLSLIQFAFGHGALLLCATLLLFSGVIASASRGGAAALLTALMAMAIFSLIVARRSHGRNGALAAITVILTPVFLFVVISGNALAERAKDLIDAGSADDVRLALWAAAQKMIGSAPWQGLGLGTFEDAYPLYAIHPLPFVMDKAHSDYLELAAGLGLPAAIAIWTSLIVLAGVCLRGAYLRRRSRYYALAGFCGLVLVGVHSAVDFSLQMPAVALVFATLLGIGLAQAQRTATS